MVLQLFSLLHSFAAPPNLIAVRQESTFNEANSLKFLRVSQCDELFCDIVSFSDRHWAIQS